MLEIDGSSGEGGGQILRSSLALATVTGRSAAVHSIRAKRSRPGLRRQHLTAVKAAAEICAARVTGDSPGSRELTFEPGQVVPGEYRFDIGTAGSASLVLQTVFPALILAGGPSTIVIEGGTHNPMAPPFDFLQQAFVPLVNRMGPSVSLSLERAGFYPAGGGRIDVSVTPCDSIGRFHLTNRGDLLEPRVRSLLSQLPGRIGETECSGVIRAFGWPGKCRQIVQLDNTRGPGNALVVELEFENLTEVFTAFGERGKPAKRVVRDVVTDVRRYLDSTAPVGENLADQLMLPMAIGAWQGTGGGMFRTLDLSEHSRTHIELIQRFLDVSINVAKQDRDDFEVRIGPAAETLGT